MQQTQLINHILDGKKQGPTFGQVNSSLKLMYANKTVFAISLKMLYWQRA